MALWDDLKADVYTWTNKPTRVAETELALRQAIRKAHRIDKFWKDLLTVAVNPTQEQIQSVDLEAECPNLRQICTVGITGRDFYLKEAAAADLLDTDGFAKTNVYYGIGMSLKIRAEAPSDTGYTIVYYRQPITSPPESISDWLLRDYRDVVVLLAASTVLGSMGEQEIKGTIDKLLVIAVANLVSDNIEVTGR